MSIDYFKLQKLVNITDCTFLGRYVAGADGAWFIWTDAHILFQRNVRLIFLLYFGVAETSLRFCVFSYV